MFVQDGVTTVDLVQTILGREREQSAPTGTPGDRVRPAEATTSKATTSK
jgi:hypothetical protein